MPYLTSMRGGANIRRHKCPKKPKKPRSHSETFGKFTLIKRQQTSPNMKMAHPTWWPNAGNISPCMLPKILLKRFFASRQRAITTLAQHLSIILLMCLYYVALLLTLRSICFSPTNELNALIELRGHFSF